MSELIQKHDSRATMRWKLLTGASALALMAYISSGSLARAEDADKPQVWIELGGQLSRLDDAIEPFSPDFASARPSIFSPSQKFEKLPLYSVDELGKISFQPENSDWVFSAAIRYGRSSANRHVRQQTEPAPTKMYLYPTIPSKAGNYYLQNPRAARFADTVDGNSEQHAILDFQAGKDVGLGLFGEHGSSTLSLGVRIAQFRDKSNIALKSDPDWHFQGKYSYYYGYKLHFIIQPYHSNAGNLLISHSFHGIGPSISWNTSTPFAGTKQDGELDFDWGLNAAVLFGRQNAREQHDTTIRYHPGGTFFHTSVLVTTTRLTPPPRTRSRNVIVPNVGGFAGLSFQYADAKVSFGYRGDFFFGAMDGGIDAAKKENVGFYGPFASVSVGLGG